MRNTVRKFMRKLMGVTVIGLIGAFAVSPMLVAGAQTVPGEGAPANPGDCTFNIDNSAFPTVAVTGTTPPADVQVEVSFQADGSPTAHVVASTHLPSGGPFSLSFNTGGSAGGVSVNYTYGNKNAYVTGCTGPGGVTVLRAEKGVNAAKLAFTGSSNTTTYVLIGAAAVVLGIVLVVAARRRSQVGA